MSRSFAMRAACLSIDEIDSDQSGGNFGWNLVAGNALFASGGSRRRWRLRQNARLRLVRTRSTAMPVGWIVRCYGSVILGQYGIIGSCRHRPEVLIRLAFALQGPGSFTSEPTGWPDKVRAGRRWG
jgi:hypothetical protein